MSLNVSSPSPLYDEYSNQSVDNSNKKNVSMINSNDPSSRPTLNNVNVSNQNISNDENNIKCSYVFKIILLGSVAVGKTAILSRYITNEFNENHNPTIKVNYKVKIENVNNETQAKLNIWDTCGNEKFRAITRQYYKDAHGIILVYDISKRETFESLDSWIEDIKNCAPANSVIILTGNKSDLADKREVSFKEGKDKADKYGYLFNEVSAKNGDNILLIFANLSEAMMDQLEKDKSESLAIGKQTLQSIRFDDSVLSNKKDAEKEKENKCC
jgi:small GTP-binding protein